MYGWNLFGLRKIFSEIVVKIPTHTSSLIYVFSKLMPFMLIIENKTEPDIILRNEYTILLPGD